MSGMSMYNLKVVDSQEDACSPDEAIQNKLEALILEIKKTNYLLNKIYERNEVNRLPKGVKLDYIRRELLIKGRVNTLEVMRILGVSRVTAINLMNILAKEDNVLKNYKGNRGLVLAKREKSNLRENPDGACEA